MRGRPALLLLIGVVTALVVGFFVFNYLLLKDYYCPADPSIHDSAMVEAAEKRELMAAMNAAYAKRPMPPTIPPGVNLFPLRRPVKVVSISNRVATVRVAQACDPGGGGDYASAWATVFQKFHPNIRFACVHIDFVWDGGSASGQCCNVAM